MDFKPVEIEAAAAGFSFSGGRGTGPKAEPGKPSRLVHQLTRSALLKEKTQMEHRPHPVCRNSGKPGDFRFKHFDLQESHKALKYSLAR